MRVLPILALLQLGMLLQQQQLPAVAAEPTVEPAVAWRSCNSEQQIINCGQIPLTRRYRAHRATCCRMYRPISLPSSAVSIASVAVAQQTSVVSGIPRNDLNLTGYLSSPPAYPYSTCGIRSAVASIPTFTTVNGATQYSVASFTVPVLNKTLIQTIKTAAQNLLPTSIRNSISSLRSVHGGSGIIHPGSAVSASEIALMINRLNSNSAVQVAARSTLINGTGVVPKNRPANGGGVWAPPTNCPSSGYQSAGSLAMPNVQIRYSGINAPGINCTAAYDPRAPTNICAHISFVELDAQMVYKMALAWQVTGDTRYASQVLSIINGWATTNKDWGWHWENGPLEAGWGIAAMARALELVRPRDTSGVINNFINWVNKVPMQDMLYYTVNLTSKNLPNQWGNWHSTLAEAYMALGVLGNNRTMYNQGVSVFTSTVADYLKWGKGSFATQYGNITRLLGECSETMRDMYHSQFGLGGLLQAAEIAWQQVVINEEVGHLVRTKTSSSNEGGVAAGFAVLDSPLLSEPGEGLLPEQLDSSSSSGAGGAAAPWGKSGGVLAAALAVLQRRQQ